MGVGLRRFLGIALLFVALAVVPTEAGSVLPKRDRLDFSSSSETPGALVAHSGGSVTWSGNALSVSGAPVYEFLAPYQHDGPSNNGEYAVTGGSLSLDTGSCDMYCSTKPNKNGYKGAYFDGGGYLVVSGEIKGLGMTSVETLIKGTFVSLPGNDPHLSLNTPVKNSKKDTGNLGGYLEITYINPDIVKELGLYGSSGEGFLTELYLNLNLNPGIWTGTVGSSDLQVVPAPEPTNLLLLGTGLLAAAWVMRRKLRT